MMENGNGISKLATRIAHRLAIADWHKTMSYYIKNELHHKRHLLAANYTGQGPMEGYHDSANPCESAYFDDSWQHPDIDVVSWNNYSATANRNFVMAEKQYEKTNCLYATSSYTGETSYIPALHFIDQPKPVLFGENGYDPYMDCDHTGFVKDLFAAAFSGTASSGMSWDESRNRTHWFWMGKIRNFLEPEFIYNVGVNLNAENWIPSRVESTGEGKSEVVYLRRASNDNSKLIGVIINRTWNWYTNGNGSPCSNTPSQASLSEELRSFNAIDGFTNNSLKVPFMGVEKRYKIEYYDPINSGLIGSLNQYSGLNEKLELAAYPMMTNARPMVFFKAWRNPVFGDEQSFYPTIETNNKLFPNYSISQKGEEYVLASDIDRSFESYIGDSASDPIIIYPNPATTNVNIVLNRNENYSIEVFDVVGELVTITEGFGNKVLLELDFLSAGHYVLRINNSKKFLLIKM